MLYVWTALIYLVAAAALVILVLVVAKRLRSRAPGLAQASNAFGLIWAGVLFVSGMIALIGQGAVAELASVDRQAAVSLWAAISTIHDATGGGIEAVGAVWIALINAAGPRTSALPQALCAPGVVRSRRRDGQALLASSVRPRNSHCGGGCPGLLEDPDHDGLDDRAQLAGVGVVFGVGFIVWFFADRTRAHTAPSGLSRISSTTADQPWI
ncbi:MAG: hypothetical protein WBG36_14190 [Ornithinimicrobium sp.]